MKKNNYSYCGYIGIIGKTNVGKSSILNAIIGSKISIISNKPGTTQKNILGIKTMKNHQFIYIDTPGIQINKKNTYIKKHISEFQKSLTLMIFIVEKTYWSLLDEKFLQIIKNFYIPVILVINKIDQINNKKKLLPFINIVNNKYNFKEIIPVSAKNGENIDRLVNIIKKNIPIGMHKFSKNDITNVSKPFIFSEIIREKFLHNLNQELPYLVNVKIEKYGINNQGIYNIYASIFVKNIRHKKIIIGNKGKKIKYCIFLAKKDIKDVVQTTDIILKLKVKVKI